MSKKKGASKSARAESAPLALVTGAAGGLGSHVVANLIEQGWRVRAVDRIPEEQAHVAQEPWFEEASERIEWVRRNLEYVADPSALCEGARVVIHAAAYVSLTEDYEAFVAPNVEITRRLWEAARRTEGMTHFVHMSCASLYKSGIGVLTEGARSRPPTTTSAPSSRASVSSRTPIRSRAPRCAGRSFAQAWCMVPTAAR